MNKSCGFLAALMIAASTMPAQAASSCNGKASTVWVAASQRLTVEALADGPRCAQAVIILVIRNSKGEPLWIDASKASSVAIFTQNPPANAKAMATSLKQWITQNDAMKKTSALPEWEPGANQPIAGEFPFYPGDGMIYGDYNKLRKANQPMFCYVSGIESAACLTVTRDGKVIKIGSQSFPG